MRQCAEAEEVGKAVRAQGQVAAGRVGTVRSPVVGIVIVGRDITQPEHSLGEVENAAEVVDEGRFLLALAVASGTRA